MPDFGIVTVETVGRDRPSITMHLEDKNHVEQLMWILEREARPTGTSTRYDEGWRKDAKDLQDALAYLELFDNV